MVKPCRSPPIAPAQCCCLVGRPACLRCCCVASMAWRAAGCGLSYPVTVSATHTHTPRHLAAAGLQPQPGVLGYAPWDSEFTAFPHMQVRGTVCWSPSACPCWCLHTTHLLVHGAHPNLDLAGDAMLAVRRLQDSQERHCGTCAGQSLPRLNRAHTETEVGLTERVRFMCFRRTRPPCGSVCVMLLLRGPFWPLSAPAGGVPCSLLLIEPAAAGQGWDCVSLHLLSAVTAAAFHTQLRGGCGGGSSVLLPVY